MKIKELRIEKGMSQTKLAELVGAKQADIHRWENNKRGITAESLIKLANVFEVSIDFILGRSDELGLVTIKSELTRPEKDLLAIYSKLPEIDRVQLIGFAQGLALARGIAI